MAQTPKSITLISPERVADMLVEVQPLAPEVYAAFKEILNGVQPASQRVPRAMRRQRVEFKPIILEDIDVVYSVKPGVCYTSTQINWESKDVQPPSGKEL